MSMVSIGYPDDCLLMLLNTTDNYFQKTAMEQFKQDDSFFTKATLIFEILAHVGYATTYGIMATQKEAKA